MGKLCPKHVEVLTRIKVIVKVKCLSSWLCLLRYYEGGLTKHQYVLG
jgi:hypothetical protein